MAGLLAMAGMAKLLFSLLGLLVVNHRSVDAAYTMTETCAYYPQGYIANPNDCQAWGYCSGGRLIANGTCGTGLLYDSYRGVCNYASQVQCGTSVKDICQNLDDPGFIADPSNCNRYCYCLNNEVIACNNCPPDQLYNPNTEECEYGYSCPTDSVCRLVKNNAFVGAPTCGQYIRCLDGTGTPQSCSTGYYNQLTGSCQPTNPCSSTTTNPVIALPPNPAICTSSYDASKGGVQYFKDGSTCYGYYTCSSAKGTGEWRKCLFATHFDYTIQKCVNPASFPCTLNRCGNVNLQFVTQVNSDCKNYYVCSNGKQSATASSCPSTNFPYFDEINGGCVAEKPSYAICSSASAPKSPK